MPEANPNPRRRWFQVSLKSLFILTLVVAAYFAGMATMMRRADEAILAEEKARKRAEAAEQALEQIRAVIMVGGASSMERYILP